MKEEEKAKAYLNKLFEKRLYTRYEIEKKLCTKGYSKEVIDKMLSHFQEKGYVNDERFAKLYVDYEFRNKKEGRRKIEYKLKIKGIDNEIISTALASITDEDEKEAIRELIERRKTLSTKEPKKMLSFFLRNGFSYQNIKEVFQEKKIGNFNLEEVV